MPCPELRASGPALWVISSRAWPARADALAAGALGALRRPRLLLGPCALRAPQKGVDVPHDRPREPVDVWSQCRTPPKMNRHRGQLVAGASGRRRHLAFCRAAPHRDGGRAPLCGCTLEGLELHAVLRVGYRELDNRLIVHRVDESSLKTVPAASASLIGVTTAGEPGCYIVENQRSRPPPTPPSPPLHAELQRTITAPRGLV